MSLLSRITDFTPGTEIKSLPFDQEFDQLVNLLSGVSQNKSIKVINNDSLFAAARFDQRGTNNIIEGYADGSEEFRVEKDGDIVANGITGAGGIYTFDNIIILPASDPTTDNQAARKKYVDDSIFTKSVTIGTEQDPNASPGVTESGRFSYIVPNGTAITIVGLAVKFQEGSHAGGTSVSYTIRVRNQAASASTDFGPISLDDTNNTIHKVYVLAVGPTVLNDFDSITYYKSAISGTVSERAVSIAALLTEKRM